MGKTNLKLYLFIFLNIRIEIVVFENPRLYSVSRERKTLQNGLTSVLQVIYSIELTAYDKRPRPCN